MKRGSVLFLLPPKGFHRGGTPESMNNTFEHRVIGMSHIFLLPGLHPLKAQAMFRETCSTVCERFWGLQVSGSKRTCSRSTFSCVLVSLPL